eukprot:CAMPEP_0182445186 /NCGR_PEP_ID=MMETSP1172-20130603/3405_1 /TAXON_ID=708627 /ORGANISM="Timspurckia oligopyrenoides, Strain CCMP3278" /LENGTH=785 /DNA_ID=CAMNT_0024640915 /DNA_START=51 /DNA_END=2408 /DNA_ORIENTATION=-
MDETTDVTDSEENTGSTNRVIHLRDVNTLLTGSELDLELLGLTEERRLYEQHQLHNQHNRNNAHHFFHYHHNNTHIRNSNTTILSSTKPQLSLHSPTAHDGESHFDMDIDENESGLIPSEAQVPPTPLIKPTFTSIYRESGLKTALVWYFKKFIKNNWGTLLFLLLATIALILLGTLAFDPLSWQGWLSFAILLLMLAFLVKGTIPTQITMLAALTAMLAFKIVTPVNALVGFSNVGVATVAVLFTVAEGIQRTSVLRPVMKFLLGRPTKMWIAQIRLFVPVAVVSAFLNNTPVVQMLIPIVQQWSRTNGFSLSRLLMPMNNATILGGTITLLGTSTNLVVVGLAQSANLLDLDGNPLSFPIFGIAPLGAPCAVVGILYLILASRFLIKDRKQGVESLVKNPREYTVALTVEEKSPIVGESIQEAGLRQLKGLFLVELTRKDGERIPAPNHETRIAAGDILLFAGVVETVTELYHIPGLVPATAETNKIQMERHKRRLVEVVISPSSYMVGVSIRESKFRTHYQAAIIAVHRHGERVTEKIGDIVLRPGDTLLVECGEEFVERFSHNHNFALISEVSGSQPPRSDLLHMLIAAGLAISMVIVATVGWMNLLTTALIAMFLLILTGCMTWNNAAGSISLPVLLTIACSFGVSEALQASGAAQQLADFIVDVFSFSRIGLLFGIYIGTALLSAVITNNAAVALMFPIVADPVTGIIYTQKLNPYAALYTMMLAASASFSTPIGYQTNLMVHGPGGYTFNDWVIFGVPLQLLLCVVSVVLAFYVFPSP